jgi:hypothetical protein
VYPRSFWLTDSLQAIMQFLTGKNNESGRICCHWPCLLQNGVGFPQISLIKRKYADKIQINEFICASALDQRNLREPYARQ